MLCVPKLTSIEIMPSCFHFNMDCNCQSIWVSMMMMWFIHHLELASKMQHSHFSTSSRIQWSIVIGVLKHRLKKVVKNIKSLKDYYLLSKVDKPIGTSFPQGQASRLPHGWLKIFGATHYDWVDCRWHGALEIKC